MMAIAVIVEIAGATAEQYDAIVAEMKLTSWPPPHNLFHVAGPSEGGWRVVDIWDSAEAFEAFAREQLGPLAQKHGMTAQPHIVVWPVHNQTPESRS
jgi:hypothetical protein